jgi:hypothetical protein
LRNISYEQLLFIPEYLNIYENAHLYIEEALNFLSRPEVSSNQKTICVHIMQHLKCDFPKYYYFVDKSVDLYNQGKIDEYKMEVLIACSGPYNMEIIRRYNDEKVRNLLRKIQNSSNTSEKFKLSLDKILTGETWKHMSSFLYEQGISSGCD